MKRYNLLKVVALSAIFAAAAACSQEKDLEAGKSADEGYEITSITARIAPLVNDDMGEGGPETKTGIVIDENNKLQIVWSEKDTLGIFSSNGFQVPFPLTGMAGGKYATFTGGGWGLMSNGTYTAYLPLIGQFYLDQTKIPLKFEGQTQKGNGSFEHLNKYDYMAAVGSSPNQTGGVDFDFEHLISLLHIKATMPHAGKYKYLILETNGTFNTEGTLNLNDCSVKVTKTSRIMVLNLEDVVVDESDLLLEAYMCILPADLSSNTILVKIIDENDNSYTCSLAAKSYVAGTIYNSRKTPVADASHSGGLPVVIINTPNNQAITSKEEYVKKTAIDVLRTNDVDIFSDVTNIKGRGNTTWGQPKKPYAIKFDKKKSLLDLPDDKSWVLLANYFDPTLLRNDVTFFLGNEFSNLDWTPHYQTVNLILNGEYKGVYQLGEKVKISKNRVNVGDDGYLMEIDFRCTSESDARYFRMPHIGSPINIKDPELEYSDPAFEYIRDRMVMIDGVLFGDNYLDPVEGWQKYMDMDSFVDWYLINEINKNADSEFGTSCYMHTKKNGKLMMGPLWDYDLAFGNYPWAHEYVNNEPTGFYILDRVPWFQRLFTDPQFVARVKERFEYFYTNRQRIYDHIDEKAAIIKTQIAADNSLWRTVSSSTDPATVQAAYQSKVDAMKTWIETRLQWLNTSYAALGPGESDGTCIFNVIAPEGIVSSTGGNKAFKVQSYRITENGASVGVAWSAQFSTDGGNTWGSKPSWLTFPNSDANGSASFKTYAASLAENTDLSNAVNKTWHGGTSVIGSETRPINLALRDVYGNWRGSDGALASGPVDAELNTANCYVISDPGWYCIPCIYGNAYKNGQDNPAAYTSTASASGGYPALNHFVNHLGNPIIQGWIQNNTGLSCVLHDDSRLEAKLMWEDKNGLVSNLSHYLERASDYASHSNDGRYIKFYVDPANIGQGNAVIALLVDGVVVWSWHIWAIEKEKLATKTVYPGSGSVANPVDMMITNLGWYDADKITYPRSVMVRLTQDISLNTVEFTLVQDQALLRGGNVYYNWGRKDPMLGIDADFSTKKQYGYDNELNTKWQIKNLGASETVSLGTAIQHPNMFYVTAVGSHPHAGHWTGTYYMNLWNASPSAAYNADVAVGKTIYDPCPVGFKVPNRNVFASITSANILGVWNQGWTIKTSANDTEGIFFPASFLRDFDSGNIDDWRRYGATISGTAYEGYLGGYYWTAASYHVHSPTYWGGVYLEIRDHGNYNPAPVFIPDANLAPVGYGFSVRPVKE